MIQRYSLPEMSEIWTDYNKFKIWLEIEVLAVEAQAELGLLPKETAQYIREKADFNTDKILEIEVTTKHDVIAFLTNVEEYVGEPSRFIHLGMTSSDILDTCFAVQCKQSGEILLKDLNELKDIIAKRAQEFKYTFCVGRTHGIHAEPTTFGLKLALWYEECKRSISRLEYSIEEISYGKINGAVGTFEHLSPDVERHVCHHLGLKQAPVTTQVIQRDSFAQFLHSVAMAGTFLEKIATEVRHLQKTEVLEAEEFFSKGQKGSSAMPHKRNPIVSEQICGLARLIRTNSLAAMENNALWHERDISHSSVERVIFPDSTILLNYLLNKTKKLVENLLVYPDNMIKNLNLTNGLIYSQKVLLELAKKGLKRQEAYVLVQKSAMKTWEEHTPFLDNLLTNTELMQHITEEEILQMFSYEGIIKSVDYIFDKCGLK
jgi:adenylosuccinate lyase